MYKREEKKIEKAIIGYLERIGAMVEGIQSGKIQVIKWKYKNYMELQSAWCPDIICFYNGEFIGIEVKKDQKTVDAWLEKEERFLRDWFLPKSYNRERDQILYKQKILDNKGTHIITCELREVVEYLESRNLL